MRQTLKQYRLHRRHSLRTVDQYVNHNWNVLAELSTHPRTKQIDMGKEPIVILIAWSTAAAKTQAAAVPPAVWLSSSSSPVTGGQLFPAVVMRWATTTQRRRRRLAVGKIGRELSTWLFQSTMIIKSRWQVASGHANDWESPTSSRHKTIVLVIVACLFSC